MSLPLKSTGSATVKHPNVQNQANQNLIPTQGHYLHVDHFKATIELNFFSGGYYADSKLQFLPKPEAEKTKQIFKLADEVFKKSKKNA